MDIVFASDKQRDLYNNFRGLVREHGDPRARKIKRRLDDLRAVETLEEMRSLSGRCHELKGDRDGQLSLDLDGPYRLIFEVANEPVPQKPDGGLDWKHVTAVRILRVEDTHG